jgi:hypothetical protein
LKKNAGRQLEGYRPMRFSPHAIRDSPDTGEGIEERARWPERVYHHAEEKKNPRHDVSGPVSRRNRAPGIYPSWDRALPWYIPPASAAIRTWRAQDTGGCGEAFKADAAAKSTTGGHPMSELHMTPYRQKIARDAVNECLQILYQRAEDEAPSLDDKGALLEKLGAARAALTDHLWEKR